MSRAALVTVLACVALALPARAQDSQFGIHGLGTPGRAEGARARGTAGAFAPFDAASPLTEAPIAGIPRSSIAVMAYTASRDLQFDSGPQAALRQSRFPTLVVAWRSPWGGNLSTGFTTYLDRSYQVVMRDSVAVRGVMQPYRDVIVSDGSVVDLRFAAARRLSPRLSVGGALHVMTGSARVSARRNWDDSVTYRNVLNVDEVQYNGLGGSVSALATLGGGLRLAGWFRSDTKLKAKVLGQVTADSDLPMRGGGGIEWAPARALRFAGSVQWAGWEGAPDGHDTFGWAAGLEAGNPNSPLRLGVRQTTLPFSPTATAPTELGVTAGFGKGFGGGRARMDFAVERLWRDGPGLEERVWTFLLGFAIQP